MKYKGLQQFLAVNEEQPSKRVTIKKGAALIFPLALLGNYLKNSGCLSENQLVHGQVGKHSDIVCLIIHLEMGLTQTPSQVTERYLIVGTLQDNINHLNCILLPFGALDKLTGEECLYREMFLLQHTTELEGLHSAFFLIFNLLDCITCCTLILENQKKKESHISENPRRM